MTNTYSGKNTVAQEMLYEYDGLNRLVCKRNNEANYVESVTYKLLTYQPDDVEETIKVSEVVTTVHSNDDGENLVVKVYSDIVGNEIAKYIADEKSYANSYDLSSNLIEEIDGDGVALKYEYDYAKRKVKTIKEHIYIENDEEKSKDLFHTIEYNSLGQKICSIDFDGNKTIYYYDKVGRLIKTDYPFCIKSLYNAKGVKIGEELQTASIKNIYDNCGQITEKISSINEQEDKVISNYYDAMGRLASTYTYTTNTNAIHTKHTYDAAGNVLSSKSFEGLSLTSNQYKELFYEYDRFNNVIKFTDFTGLTEKTIYSQTGVLEEKIAKDGTVTKYEYDKMMRVVKETTIKLSGESETKETTFYQNGLVKEQSVVLNNIYFKPNFNDINFLSPQKISYKYDGKSRIVQQIDPQGEEKNFEYTKTNKRTKFSFKFVKNDVENTFETCYTYDKNNNLKQIISHEKQGETVTEKVLASFEYDHNANKVKEIKANGTISEYEYNIVGLPTKITHTQNGNIVSSFVYTYNFDATVSSKLDKEGQITYYVYDKAKKLLLETEKNQNYAQVVFDKPVVTSETLINELTYTYDAYGNRLSVESSTFPKYKTVYEYDNADRLLKETTTRDSNVEVTTHEYDDNGDLVKTVKGTGASAKLIERKYSPTRKQIYYAKEDLKIYYCYRPDGLRHYKKVVNGNLVSATFYSYDDDSIVMESSASSQCKGIYIRAGAKIVAQKIGTNYVYYLHNGHGDVVNTLSEQGDTLKSYKYDSFGNILNPAIVGDVNNPINIDQNTFGYAGEYLDRETNELYLRARYYDSTNGRFTQQDPANSGNNFYNYCGNDPVNKTDPSGNIALFVVTALAGMAIGAIVGGVNAYNKGESILKGVLGGAVIGAAIGALAGLFVAGGLAGGVAATPAAVVKGGAAVATAFVAGGVPAAANVINTNLYLAETSVFSGISNGIQFLQNKFFPSQAAQAANTSSAAAHQVAQSAARVANSSNTQSTASVANNTAETARLVADLGDDYVGNHTVYTSPGADGSHKIPEYIGRTIDFVRRQLEHANGHNTGNIIRNISKVCEGLSYNAARGFEQYLIELHKLENLSNVINSVSPFAKNYKTLFAMGEAVYNVLHAHGVV